jgi:uncharacterized protein (DUF1810 family)
MPTNELNRFHDAQNFIIDRVYGELENGKKEGHWMWYVFPQVSGLGRSSAAESFAIKGLAEAKAYFDDPLLKDRLLKCTELFLRHKAKSPLEILGFPDHLKMKSSMTLFAICQNETSLFQEVLEVFYEGDRCSHTEDFLRTFQ